MRVKIGIILFYYCIKTAGAIVGGQMTGHNLGIGMDIHKFRNESYPAVGIDQEKLGLVGVYIISRRGLEASLILSAENTDGTSACQRRLLPRHARGSRSNCQRRNAAAHQ